MGRIPYIKICVVSIISVLSCAYNIINADALKTPEDFLRPIHLTRPGLRCFFKHVYNDPYYGSEFLPACFIHIEDFFSCMPSIERKDAFSHSFITLFHNKLKEARWVNPFAFEQALVAIKTWMPRVISYGMLELEKKTNLMLEKFAHKIISKTDTASRSEVVEAYSTKLYNLYMGTHKPVYARVQELMSSFIESACEKLIWSHKDGIETWEIFKRLDALIYELYKTKVISDKAVMQRILCSLVCRFVYFLDTLGVGLDDAALDTIEKECAENCSIVSFALPEQEDLVLSKKDFLLNSVKQVRFKKFAYINGFIA
jgi:hypothetical protein